MTRVSQVLKYARWRRNASTEALKLTTASSQAERPSTLVLFKLYIWLGWSVAITERKTANQSNPGCLSALIGNFALTHSTFDSIAEIFFLSDGDGISTSHCRYPAVWSKIHRLVRRLLWCDWIWLSRDNNVLQKIEISIIYSRLP